MYNEEETRVLKQLGIQSFREITREGLVQFASSLHRLDPEVAKAIIAQFPDFALASKEMATALFETYRQSIEASNTCYEKSIDSINTIIEVLRDCLNDENSAVENKTEIVNALLELAHLVQVMESENKQHHQKMFVWSIFGTIGIIGVLSAVLGGNISFPNGKNG